MTEPPPRIIGRTSSSFTRVARIFAHELDVAYGFVSVRDLLSLDPADYAGNPALKLPSLETDTAAWYGSLNICRELARRSQRQLRIVWPEHLERPLAANAQELALQAMSSEVAIIMGQSAAGGADNPHQQKLRASLTNSLAWLNAKLPRILEELPQDRQLSYLEVTLFCLITHLPFRGVLNTDEYPELNRLASAHEARPSAAATYYHFQS